MYSYIQGKLVEKNPAYVVIETNGIGYYISISLNTYGSIPDQENCKLFIHQVVREDALLLYGFITMEERELFRNLISVSGIGANTARLILSSLQTSEIIEAISLGNYALLQSVKGIGAKTAQRLVVDLKDRISGVGNASEKLNLAHNTQKNEALSGLITLGFNKNVAEKAIDKVLKKENSGLSVEDLIKNALKIL